jgi:hypothetical protein
MSDNKSQFGFQPENYKILLIGLAINVLGFILMIGGAATEANDFDSNELFSARRITIAPILIVLGYVVILFAIMKRKSTKE